MYEVELNAEPEHFLDWDAPLNQQSEHVKDALATIPWATDYLKSGNLIGGQIAPKTAEGARQLMEAGIPGIKYLDQGSRGNAAQLAADLDQVREAIALVEKQTGSPTQAMRLANLRADEADLTAKYKAASSPTYNYVVFSPEVIDIKRRYRRGGTGSHEMCESQTTNSATTSGSARRSSADSRTRRRW